MTRKDFGHSSTQQLSLVDLVYVSWPFVSVLIMVVQQNDVIYLS